MNLLQVNDTVEVNAVRQPRHTGWKASHITLVSDEWDSISDVYLKVGVITNLTNDGGGAINNQYSFTAKCLKVLFSFFKYQYIHALF